MKRVVVLERDAIRRALLQCAMPRESEVSFALHIDEVAEADIVFVGPNPGRPLKEVCADLARRMTVVLFDERYSDEQVARGEVEGYGAFSFIPPPFGADAISRLLYQSRSEVSRTLAETQRRRDSRAGADADTAEAGAPMESNERLLERFRERTDTIFRNLDRLDFYQILEVPRQASATEIREAYRLRTLEFHPDRFAADPNQEFRRKLYEITKAVNQAFAVLSDATKRAAFDEERRSRERPGIRRR